MKHKHYYVTLSIRIHEDGYNKLTEIAKALNSPKFEHMYITIAPDDLIPPQYHDTLSGFITLCIDAFSKIQKGLH